VSDNDPASEFDGQGWSKRLARLIALELSVGFRKFGIDRIRAVAIDCHPWHSNGLSLSLLTDREWPDLDPESAKWDIASWRLYAFHSAPHRQWPFGEELIREARQYYDGVEDRKELAARRDVIVQCCVDAMNNPAVEKELKRYPKTADFEIYVGHADAPEENFYSPKK
jgi:hypothetical protein